MQDILADWATQARNCLAQTTDVTLRRNWVALADLCEHVRVIYSEVMGGNAIAPHVEPSVGERIALALTETDKSIALLEVRLSSAEATIAHLNRVRWWQFWRRKEIVK